MEKQLVEREETSVSVQSMNPMQLVSMAVQSNADIDKLERLMDLQERWEKQNSRKRFLEAMSEFQRICPDILKLKSAHNSTYAPLGDIVAQIREPLSKCGLSYRFEQDHTSGIRVKCIVSHIDGHSESTEMSAPADGSGNKNQIQAIASTVTYLSRYTLTAALGIVTADADIDGRLPSDNSDLITDEQYRELFMEMCDQSGRFTQKGQNVATLFKITDIKLVKASQFDRIMKMASK